MANAKSLPYAETRKEGVKHVGRVGRADGLAQPFGRRADAICKQNKIGREWGSGGVGEWRSLGEEGSGLNQSRRIATKGGARVARLGRLALEFRGNCAAERIKPLACLRAHRDGR